MKPKKESVVRNNLPLRFASSFVGREQELNILREKLLPYPHSRHPVVQIVGLGGIGKTALALEIAYHYLNISSNDSSYFDTIIWVNLNRSVIRNKGLFQQKPQEVSLKEIIYTILFVLDKPNLLSLTFDEQLINLRSELEKSRSLIILDGFEVLSSEATIKFLNELPAPTKALITSRQAISFFYKLQLRELTYEDSERLFDTLGYLREVEVSRLEKEKVLKASNGIPLAVEWFVGQLGLGFGVDKLTSQLVKSNRDDTKDLLHFLFDETINKIKDRHSYKILISLALLGGSGDRQSIKFISGLSDTDSDEGLIELIDFSLVSREGTNFILSPLARDYVEGFLREASLSSNNEALVDWTRILSQTDINKQRELVDEKFDIFLAHNSSEKISVQKIANELRRRKIKPWVDVEQIRPGALFQSSITAAINNVKTVAVIIGNSGVGNFQSLEIKTFISRAVNAGIPVIPILLPGTASIKDENLLFLMEFQWISFPNLDDGTAYDLLEWGITGKKPKSLLNFDE